VDEALWRVMRFDDRVQAGLFSRERLAKTFPVSAVTRPFRFNAYYEEYQVARHHRTGAWSWPA